ncbi:MAG: hypothetical protein LBM77_02940 [Spirochaetaceae bacterium]|nr:hypothetical protein [Spirochaetaceae bacterium]
MGYFKRGFTLLLIITSVFFSVGCSQSAPEIMHGSIFLTVYEGEEGQNEERYSFFVLPRDDDGFGDLAELDLYNDNAGLSWKMTDADWVSYTDNGDTWIGTRAIAMSDNASLPRGLFRAVIIDKGGERSEKTFSFDAPAVLPYAFPKFNWMPDTRTYKIESQYPENILLCYDEGGNFLSELPVLIMEGNLNSLGLPPKAQAVELWARDSEQSISALSKMVRVR